MNTQIFSDALSAIDDSFITEAAAYSRKGLLPKKVLSLAACAVVLFAALFGLLAVLGNSTPVYADAIEIQPPFGLKWGMTVEQVEKVLREKGDLQKIEMPTGTRLYLNAWQGTVYGNETETFGFTPADASGRQTVCFDFTRPITYAGKEIPALLKDVQACVQGNVQDVVENVQEDVKIRYTAPQSENGMYVFADARLAAAMQAEDFHKAVNMVGLAMGELTDELSLEETEQIRTDPENRTRYYPVIYVVADEADPLTEWKKDCVSIMVLGNAACFFPYL